MIPIDELHHFSERLVETTNQIVSPNLNIHVELSNPIGELMGFPGPGTAATAPRISSACNAPQKATWVAFNRRCEAWQQRVDQETTEALQREGLKAGGCWGRVGDVAPDFFQMTVLCYKIV